MPSCPLVTFPSSASLYLPLAAVGSVTREGFSVKETVRWTVFRKKSLSDSESQLAFAAGKGGDSHHLLQKNRGQ